MRSLISVSATIVFLIILAAFPPLGYVSSTSNGSFTMTIGGYLITGQLTDWKIQADNSVTALVSVDQTVPVTFGSAHVVGSGKLVGAVSGDSVQGTVEGFSGNLQLCFLLFFCQSSDYVGAGNWAGTVQNGKGSGTFQGTVSFSQPLVGVPQLAHVTGTWSTS